MRIVIGIMLVIFCVYESVSLVRDIKKRRAEKRVAKQNENQPIENVSTELEEVSDSDDKSKKGVK